VLLVLVAEVLGAVFSGSLALLSDAAHMFTDAAALGIALAAARIGRRPADPRRSFGYRRFEVLAALLNAQLLLVAAAYIAFEALRRLREPPEIDSSVMLLIALLGLAVNLAGMRMLAGRQDASLNLKGAYLEVWSDMLGSVGVIVAAVLIRFTGWAWVDSVVALAIAAWVVPRTWALLRETLHVLLEGVPAHIDAAEVERALAADPGVAGVHDLHVWSIGTGEVSLTVHVVLADASAPDEPMLRRLRSMLAAAFDIHHATVQLERTPCEQAGAPHAFGAAA